MTVMVIFMLMLMCCFSSLSFAQIEILAGGQRYESLETYKVFREVKKTDVKEAKNDVPLEKTTIQEGSLKPAKAIQRSARTIVLADLPDRATLKKLQWINVNPTAHGKFLANPQAWRNPKPVLVRMIDSQRLEEAIEKAMKQNPGPTMIVSKDNTVKILSLSGD